MRKIYFAVICDSISTNVKKIEFDRNLTDLNADDVKEMTEMMSSNDRDWKDVLSGKRAAVIFDVAMTEKIRINDGIVKIRLDY